MSNYRRSSNKSSSGGIGTLGVIQIVFIILKCTGLINWSWAAVLIPLWIELGIVALVILIIWLAKLW